MSCRDFAAKAVKDATTARGNVTVNDEKYDILMEYCDAIDWFANVAGGEVIESIVDLRKGLVVIRIQTDELIVEKDDRDFYDLADRAVAVNFCKGDGEDILYADFVFPSVWNEV